MHWMARKGTTVWPCKAQMRLCVICRTTCALCIVTRFAPRREAVPLQ